MKFTTAMFNVRPVAGAGGPVWVRKIHERRFSFCGPEGRQDVLFPAGVSAPATLRRRFL